jgi:hypothetical protein
VFNRLRSKSFFKNIAHDHIEKIDNIVMIICAVMLESKKIRKIFIILLF